MDWTEWGQKRLPFGKHNGKTYNEVAEKDPSYASWAIGQANPSEALNDFADYLKASKLRQQNPSSSVSLNLFSCHSKSLSSTSATQQHSSTQSFITPPSVNPLDFEFDEITTESNPTTFPPASFKTPPLEYRQKTPSIPFHNNNNNHSIEQYASYATNSNSSINPSPNNTSHPSLNTHSQATPFNSSLPPLDTIVFELISPEHFIILTKGLKGKLSTYLPSFLYNLISNLKDNTHFDEKKDQTSSTITKKTLTKRNVFEGTHFSTVFHANVYPEIKRLIFESCHVVKLEELPTFVLLAFNAFRPYLAQSFLMHRRSANILTQCISPRTSSKQNQLEVLLGPTLLDTLKPFQLEGIAFGLSRNGRCLIGDEMGLGKTLQALGIAAVFHDEWPCLIIAPSSIRFQWRDQIETWLSHLINPSEILIVRTGKDNINLNQHKVVIASYDLIKNTKFHLPYNVVICDESHYLKNLTSQRSSIILPLLQKARRAILLSGTPALNRPTELYPQLSALIPKFAAAKEFSSRYSEVKINPWSQKPEFTGYRLTEELHCLLHHTVMIRRLKKEVQTQLPPKMRSKIPVECSVKEVLEIKKLMETHHIETQSNSESIFQALRVASVQNEEEDEQTSMNSRETVKNVIGQLFLLSGRGKIVAAAEHAIHLVDSGAKLLLFAHHKDVMDGLELRIKQHKIKHIRIDGSVKETSREERIKEFQSNENYRIALLSITACSHGLNLTAAGTVVFAELYWVPGVVVQAEDRSHRLGTEYETINIHYLIGEGTIDELMWKILLSKWSCVTSALDGQTERYDTREVSSSFAKLQILTTSLHDSYKKKKPVFPSLLKSTSNFESPSSSASPLLTNNTINSNNSCSQPRNNSCSPPVKDKTPSLATLLQSQLGPVPRYKNKSSFVLPIEETQTNFQYELDKDNNHNNDESTRGKRANSYKNINCTSNNHNIDNATMLPKRHCSHRMSHEENNFHEGPKTLNSLRQLFRKNAKQERQELFSD